MKHITTIIAVLLLAAVIGWNSVHFLGAKEIIRTKDLTFLPSPEVAQVMAFGHNNSVARLRWIDAFAYFQLQLDRKDDTVAGGGKGFERLYDTLIALDPLYLPFYQHASLAVGGILGRRDRELGYLMRGIFNIPGQTGLWRQAASVLYVEFTWDERQPILMDQFLASWADAESSDAGRVQVWEWKASMARRRFKGLEQLPYWLDRLGESKAHTPVGDFIEATIREQLVTYATSELTAVAADRRKAGLPVDRIEDLLDPVRLHVRHLDRRWGPVDIDDHGQLVLRSDPYGYSYAIVDGAVVSIGKAMHQFERSVATVNMKIANQGKATLEAVAAAGVPLPTPPAGASMRMQDCYLYPVLPVPPYPPWNIR